MCTGKLINSQKSYLSLCNVRFNLEATLNCTDCKHAFPGPGGGLGFTCIHHLKHCFKYRLKGVRFLSGVRDFSILHSLQTGPGVHPASYTTDSGVFPRGTSGRELKMTIHSHTVSRFKNGGAIPQPHMFTV
jgi:hypothetical protein